MKYPDWYRDWLDSVREDAREFGEWRASDMSNTGDVQYHYHQFLLELGAIIDEEKPLNSHKWLDRGTREIDKIVNRLSDKYSIPDDDTQPSLYSAEGAMFGYKTIDPDNPPIGAVRRKQLFTSLAALIDYLFDVPYPAGIQEVRVNGVVIGYYLWVEK